MPASTLGVIINLSWVDFGCENIHSDPLCCEQAGTVSNCYSTSCTTTTQSFMGWVVWGGPRHYVVTPTQVEVELRLSWAVTIYFPFSKCNKYCRLDITQSHGHNLFSCLSQISSWFTFIMFVFKSVNSSAL